MKKRNIILEDMAIVVLLILLSACLFMTIFDIVADRIEERDEVDQIQADEQAGYLLQQEIRMSGIYGINLNGNPEL